MVGQAKKESSESAIIVRRDLTSFLHWQVRAWQQSNLLREGTVARRRLQVSVRARARRRRREAVSDDIPMSLCAVTCSLARQGRAHSKVSDGLSCQWTRNPAPPRSRGWPAWELVCAYYVTVPSDGPTRMTEASPRGHLARASMEGFRTGALETDGSPQRADSPH
jgi:hypothetical protein